MECYTARLASFAKRNRVKNPTLTTTTNIKWSHPSSFKATPETLAEAGFYFKPSWEDRDNVTCFICEKELSHWTDDDDPFEIHWTKCKTSCVWAQVRCGLIDDMDDDGNYTFTNKTRLPGSKSMEKGRAGTFTTNNWWPHDAIKNHGANSKRMAQAGFVYTPQTPGDDTASCFYCNISLSGWEPEDEPMEEHKKREKKSGIPCPFFSPMSTTGNALPASKSSSSSIVKPKAKPKTKPPSKSKPTSKSRSRDAGESEIDSEVAAPVAKPKPRSRSKVAKSQSCPESESDAPSKPKSVRRKSRAAVGKAGKSPGVALHLEDEAGGTRSEVSDVMEVVLTDDEDKSKAAHQVPTRQRQVVSKLAKKGKRKKSSNENVPEARTEQGQAPDLDELMEDDPTKRLPPPSTPPPLLRSKYPAQIVRVDHLVNGDLHPPLLPRPPSDLPTFLPPLALMPIPHIVSLTNAEQDMTVEQWIRHEILVQYEQLKGDGEKQIDAFRERAQEVRKRIDTL